MVKQLTCVVKQLKSESKKIKAAHKCGNYTPHFGVWYNYTPQIPHLGCWWGVKTIPTHFAHFRTYFKFWRGYHFLFSLFNRWGKGPTETMLKKKHAKLMKNRTTCHHFLYNCQHTTCHFLFQQPPPPPVLRFHGSSFQHLLHHQHFQFLFKNIPEHLQQVTHFWVT